MMIKKIILLFFSILVLFCSCSVSKKLSTTKPPITQLTETSQKKFDYYFYEALGLKEEEKYDQAMDAFRFCLSIDSTDAATLSETGILHAIVGHLSLHRKTL